MKKTAEEYVFERDRSEFSLGDTIDIKTGLILASLTFLAIQAGELFKRPLHSYQIVAFGVSVAAMILGGIFSTAVLWPRDYSLEATPDEYDDWLAKMGSYREMYPDAKPTDENELIGVRLKAAKERILINYSINQKKSTLMFLAFRCAVVSFLANLFTLAMRLF